MSLTSDSLNLSRFSTTIPTTADNQKLLEADNGVITLGSTALTAKVTLPEAQCTQAKFICAHLFPSPTAKYKDASATAAPNDLRKNITCLSLVTPAILKKCHPGR